MRLLQNWTQKQGRFQWVVLSLAIGLGSVADSPVGRADDGIQLLQRRPTLVQLQTEIAQQSGRQGSQVVLNGRPWTIAWREWQNEAGQTTIGISDGGLVRLVGVELLSTTNPTQQPIQWFPQNSQDILNLPARKIGPYRYLDLTMLAQKQGWQWSIRGNTLNITVPPARLLAVQQTPLLRGGRITLDLDRPTSWQLSQRGQELIIRLDAEPVPELLPPPTPTPTPSSSLGAPGWPPAAGVPPLTPQPLPTPVVPVIRPKVERSNNQVTVTVMGSQTAQPRVLMSANPPRLVINFEPDAIAEREIQWAPGIRWQQRNISLGLDRFPVVLLALNLRQSGLKLQPIWSRPETQVGTTPLLTMAQQWQAVAAINAGFFNRNTQLPLGAIRSEGRWFSGPILNRGAIAWDNAGSVKMARLTLQEAIITNQGLRLLLTTLNSGYVQAGMARYTREWGSTYTTLSDNELLVVVNNNRVTEQQVAGPAGKTSIVIPPSGYLLVLRANQAATIQGMATALGVGLPLQLEQVVTPAELAQYPYIVGAGPLLIQNQRIVLDAKSERFSDNFIREAAVRSAIGRVNSDTLLLVTVQHRVGGKGPTLAELAQVMQKLGVTDALNLDGGSSASLYLSDQLLNRLPSTAARVHNGIGIFTP